MDQDEKPSLLQQKFILFDFQTTGPNPATSDIIEAGWGLYQAAADPFRVDWQIHLLALQKALPVRIQRLTGLPATHGLGEQVIAYDVMIAELSCFLQEHAALPILVHYARFKRPFLLKVMADAGYVDPGSPWTSLSDRIVCTYELARHRMPHLKSFSLRAVAGYAGYSVGEKKRSRDHLIATAFIWKYLAEESWSQDDPVQTLPLHDVRIREKRLRLPDKPGVYYFLDQADQVLYVGKASNLKLRLNSYFRGQKTKGSRLNEMLTRSVSFASVAFQTELEALFFENDEIKRLDPPYNRLLKSAGRRIPLTVWR